MHIETSERNGYLIVAVQNPRLDARIAPDFKSAMSGFIAQGRRHIVLDLSRVNLIDSSGLGAIVAALKHMNGAGTLSISGLRDSTLTLFRLTRMDRVFELFESADDAVAATPGTPQS